MVLGRASGRASARVTCAQFKHCNLHNVLEVTGQACGRRPRTGRQEKVRITAVSVEPTATATCCSVLFCCEPGLQKAVLETRTFSQRSQHNDQLKDFKDSSVPAFHLSVLYKRSTLLGRSPPFFFCLDAHSFLDNKDVCERLRG